MLNDTNIIIVQLHIELPLTCYYTFHKSFHRNIFIYFLVFFFCSWKIKVTHNYHILYDAITYNLLHFLFNVLFNMIGHQQSIQKFNKLSNKSLYRFCFFLRKEFFLT